MTTINDKVDTLQEDMTQLKADFAIIKPPSSKLTASWTRDSEPTTNTRWPTTSEA